jgi:flagellar assembly protein FliH
MGMIRRADIETYSRDALVMNLGDLEAQGQSILRVATEHAERIVTEAHTERAKLLDGAKDTGHGEGFAAGHAEGLALGQKEGFNNALVEHNEQIASLAAQWNDMLASFAQSRDTLYQQARRDVVELATLVAEKITKRTISLDPSIVETQMESVLDTLASSTGLVLRVNPEDLAYAEKVLPGLIADCMHCAHAEVIGDDKLERGSCVAETEGRGVIDASVKTQLDRIVEALIPDHKGQDADIDRQGDAA